MTVRENMGFGLKMTGHDKEDVEARVQKAADILHLEQLLDRKPKALSGGQRQRVAIGRSIVREPKVFLFDEPLSNLDAELRVRMRLEIAKLHDDLGATMVYVTHDQVEAMTLADKIVVLRAGIIEQAGAPMQLYNDPDNVFVAGFIGSPKMNILNAEVINSDTTTATVQLTDYANDAFYITCETPLQQGAKVLVGIRPEHFTATGDGVLQTHIEVVESLGGSSFGYANANSDSPLTVSLEEDQLAAAKGDFNARFTTGRAFLFDAETQRRLR